MKTDGTETKSTKAVTPKKQAKTLAEYLVQHKEVIEQILPQHVGIDRFLRITLSSIYANPKLAKCDFRSMLLAVKEAAQLGLEPGGVLGHAALIPYRNTKKGIYEAKFQLMYKGLLDLSYRSGKIQTMTAHEVCDGDLFEYEHGLDQKLKHVPADHDRGQPLRYYAYYITKDGASDFQVMSKEDVAKHAKRFSKNFNDKESPGKQTLIRWR